MSFPSLRQAPADTGGDMVPELAEMLCSRLCHDLVSPVGAIANGVELMEDARADGGDGGLGEEALGLIGDSARQATARLRLFRLAYGAAGSHATLADADVRGALVGWFVGGRVALDWPPGTALPARPGLAKLVLNLILLAEECLPQGGRVTLEAGVSPPGEGGPGEGEVRVAALGPGATLRPESALALDMGRRGGADEGAAGGGVLTPRSVQAYYCRHWAGKIGVGFAVLSGNPDRVAFRVALPPLA